MLKRTLAALIVALTAFCGGTAQAEPLKLTFSTGSVGGGFFAVGSGIAGFASQKIPGISITAISAAGVVESINRLEQGKADINWFHSTPKSGVSPITQWVMQMDIQQRKLTG